MKGKDFWDEKYQTGKTGWNIGAVSPPLKTYIDQLVNKNQKILIPGTGNSYEAEYLFQKGFNEVYVADISELPLKNFAKRVPNFPQSHLLHIDFFKLKGQFDLIFEQTFFCALEPSHRQDYVNQIYNLLKPEGQLVGLLFDFPLEEIGPPFGGDKEEYQKLFSEKFDIQKMERAYNSIPPRAGNELFIKLKRK